MIPKCGSWIANTLIISTVLADVVAGGKIGTNPNGSKNEAGLPHLFERAPTDREPSCMSDCDNSSLGHVETTKYVSTSLTDTHVLASSPDSDVKTDHVPSNRTAV